MKDGFAALSKKPDSSIVRAVEFVREGEAEAVVSVGNTVGAVAAAQIKLRLLRGVRRAGIAVPLPTMRGTTVVIDMGAGVAAKPEHLVGYAVMASIYTEEVLGKRDPTVALLNVGRETSKGDSVLKKAYSLLEDAPLNFRGNAEGSDIYRGRFDVVVCDGFVGNVVLKAGEGAAKFFVHVVREEFAESGLRSRLGALLARPALGRVRRRLDYAEWGGAPLLGVKGVLIKGHGRSNGRAVANAIRVAVEAVRKDVNRKIVEKLGGMTGDG
jgi:glycerol-3-phosphate acyltransferase PlsX